MKRINLIDSNQGNGLTRVQDVCWQRLLKLDNGYFEKMGTYTSFIQTMAY